MMFIVKPCPSDSPATKQTAQMTHFNTRGSCGIQPINDKDYIRNRGVGVNSSILLDRNTTLCRLVPPLTTLLPITSVWLAVATEIYLLDVGGGRGVRVDCSYCAGSLRSCKSTGQFWLNKIERRLVIWPAKIKVSAFVYCQVRKGLRWREQALADIALTETVIQEDKQRGTVINIQGSRQLVTKTGLLKSLFISC